MVPCLLTIGRSPLAYCAPSAIRELQADARRTGKGQPSLQISLVDVRNALGLPAAQSHLVLEGLNASGWSIDSRTVNPGDLFFAIKGEIHDGHAFIGQAFE